MPELLEIFGRHLLRHCHAHYPAFVEYCPDGLTFPESVETYVHVEVRQLYPDVELPRFITARQGPGRLRFDNYSNRDLGNFAADLINDILDLAKIESAPNEIPLAPLPSHPPSAAPAWRSCNPWPPAAAKTSAPNLFSSAATPAALVLRHLQHRAPA